MREAMEPLFLKAGVDLVFNGHVHAYERTHPIARGRVAKDGIPYKYPSSEALVRTGLPDLPGVWCPPKPRSAARMPSRPALRSFLGLLLEQKRIHCDELVRGYDHWAGLGGVEKPDMSMLPPMDEAEPPLIKLHALLALKALKYNKRANARWEVLIQYQLAPEPEEDCDAQAVAAELRKAEAKIKGLEDLLTEGLAEFSDARAALRMHFFDKDADIPLSTQLANRLAGTMFGEILQNRFEHLDTPELAARQLGAHEVFGGGAEAGESPYPFLIPAAEAAEELSIDNAILAECVVQLVYGAVKTR